MALPVRPSSRKSQPPQMFPSAGRDFAPLHLSSTTWLRIETSIIRRRVMPIHSACSLIGRSCLHALHQELRMERHNLPIGHESHNISLETDLKGSVHWGWVAEAGARKVGSDTLIVGKLLADSGRAGMV